MADFAAEGERSLAILPVARFRDGSTVYSVIIPGGDGIDHGYWVVLTVAWWRSALPWLPCTSTWEAQNRLVQAGPA